MYKPYALPKMSDRDRRYFLNQRQKYESNCAKLFDLCRSPSLSKNRIQQALAFQPWAFAIRDYNDMLPLHVVCESFKSGGGSVDVVKYLLELYPKSVEKGDENGSLPLHLACEGGAPLQVVQYLYELYPKSVEKSNTKSYPPLHNIVCRCGACNQKSYHPLHLACEFGASFQVVQYLYEQTPQSVRDKPEKCGGLWTPLHHACRGGCSPLDVIQYLVGKCHENVS